MKERSGMPYDVVAYEADEDAMLLSAEQEGFFHRLLRRAWMNGSIPDDVDKLAIICRAVTKNQMRRAWESIRPLWVPHPSEPGRLVNPKQESERMFVEAKSDSARGSSEARWEQERKRKQNKESDDANALRTHSDGTTHAMPARSNASPSPPRPKGNIGEVKNTSPSSGPTKPAPHRPRDLAFDLFVEAHERTLDALYVPIDADFVLLAKLRKAYKINAREPPPHWKEAVTNYFSSPLGNYTLKDLCSRFAVFRNGPVSQFNKLEGNNGKRTDDPNLTAAKDFVSRKLAETVQPDFSNVRKNLK